MKKNIILGVGLVMAVGLLAGSAMASPAMNIPFLEKMKVQAFWGAGQNAASSENLNLPIPFTEGCELSNVITTNDQVSYYFDHSCGLEIFQGEKDVVVTHSKDLPSAQIEYTVSLGTGSVSAAYNIQWQ